MDVQHRRSSVLVSAAGDLDEDAGEVLQRALDHVTMDEQDLLVDLHGVAAMDADGLPTSWTCTGAQRACT
ncbi:hypothetical protein ACFVX6_30480 [Streptomyces sp. NPDC058289]|uniref:hypothetical protein n=1 Tax=Streptomyces sp. NPDC058289 TaxID=3346425 RepID=UPI0036E98022